MSSPNIETISKSELLKLKDDYIFHGSPALFEECKPHQSKDSRHIKGNEHFAIYGSNNLSFAILFAFEKLPHTTASWSAQCDEFGNYFASLYEGTYIEESAYGYLYCFDPKYFQPIKKGDCQYICKTSLTPKRIFKIYYKDYQQLFEDTAYGLFDECNQ